MGDVKAASIVTFTNLIFAKGTTLIKIKDYIINKYQGDLFRYIFVGCTTFMIDLVILIYLRELLKLNIAYAASISYWVSILYNFTLNRWWTFNSAENTSLKKHLLLYSCLLGFNYIFTVVFVSFFSNFINYSVAKVLCVGIQITWTYYIYKRYIFVTH